MLALVLAAVIGLASGVAVPPAPTRWVEDGVGFLSPAVRDQLDRRLEAYQHATGHQVVVWIGDSTGDVPLDDWAVRTFAAWRVGRQGVDDGLVIFVLAADRAIDIEVGYGLEDRVPDVVAARLIREVMTPMLQAGERDAAVSAGVDGVLAAIEGRPWTGPDAPAGQLPLSPLELVLGGLAALALLILVVRHPRLALMALWLVSAGRSGGRGGGGGGGGFTGGGGRSGGGGARGRW